MRGLEVDAEYWDKLAAAFERYTRECVADYEREDVQDPPLSIRFRRRMNQVFRECCGEKYIPHPEVEADGK